MKITSAEDLGRIVRQRRIDRGLSQTELAESVGTTRQWLSRFEQGTSDASTDRLLSLLRQLDLSLDARPNEQEFVTVQAPRLGLDNQFAAINAAVLANVAKAAKALQSVSINAASITSPLSAEVMSGMQESLRSLASASRQDAPDRSPTPEPGNGGMTP